MKFFVCCKSIVCDRTSVWEEKNCTHAHLSYTYIHTQTKTHITCQSLVIVSLFSDIFLLLFSFSFFFISFFFLMYVSMIPNNMSCFLASNIIWKKTYGTDIRDWLIFQYYRFHVIVTITFKKEKKTHQLFYPVNAQ